MADLQVVAASDGTIVWVSGSLCGAVHDIKAVRHLADKVCVGAGSHIHVPVASKRPTRLWGGFAALENG